MAEITAAMVMKLRDETRPPDDGLQEGASGERWRLRSSPSSKLREDGIKIHGDAAGSQHRGRPAGRLCEPQAAGRRDDRAASRVGAGGQARGARRRWRTIWPSSSPQVPARRRRTSSGSSPLRAAKARRSASGKTKSKARCAKCCGWPEFMRVDAPIGRLRPSRRQERRAARSRRRQRRTGQEHRHARHRDEAEGDDARTSSTRRWSKKSVKSSPSRPARKASRKTSSKR